MPRLEAVRRIVGWDVGGAHVKACLLDTRPGADPVVRDIAQWPCPLWQGLGHLDAVIAQARMRWPEAWDDRAGATRHGVTMTGEMVDCFANRQDGVRRLAAHLAEALGPSLRLYAGLSSGSFADAASGRWLTPQAASTHWAAVASANWRATAEVVAARCPDAVLVDIGSTTTDLIVLRGGRMATPGASDAERLATGALVYQGVVRTPLCALAQRVPFRGTQVNVMNEFFATTADVYRLTRELDPAHDQQATADGAAKDDAATRQRLARMIGRDAHEAGDAAWLALARHWRGAQLDEVAGQLERVLAGSGLPADAPLVGAGCGDFLAAALALRSGRPYRRFAGGVVPLGDAADLATWAQVCAPAVAVAWLSAQPA
jgi:(4-(4-[2-(gamma-L-glutamylamino)ethyl]phenoxymethyl)furan-2-yl)methanamine synthase